MKKLIPIFILVLASCKPVERIVEKTIIEEKVDTVERLVKVRAEVPVYIPGDTVIRISERIVWREGKKLNVPPIYSFGKLAWSKAWVESNILFNELVEIDTTIYARYDSLVAVNDILRTKSTTTTKAETKIITKNSGWAKFCIKWFFGTIILIALCVVFKVYNPMRW